MNITADPSAIFYSMKRLLKMEEYTAWPAIAAAPTPRAITNIAIAGISECPSRKKKEREERMRPDTAHFRTNAYPSHASLHAIASGEQMH